MGLFHTVGRLAILGLLIMGVRKALEQYEHKAEALAQRIESGEASPKIDALARIHDALHKRASVTETANSDASNGNL